MSSLGARHLGFVEGFVLWHYYTFATFGILVFFDVSMISKDPGKDILYTRYCTHKLTRVKFEVKLEVQPRVKLST